MIDCKLYTLAGILTASILAYFAKQTLSLLRAKSHSLWTIFFSFMFGLLGMLAVWSLALVPLFVISRIVKEEGLEEMFYITMAIAGVLGFIIGVWFCLAKLDTLE